MASCVGGDDGEENEVELGSVRLGRVVNNARGKYASTVTNLVIKPPKARCREFISVFFDENLEFGRGIRMNIRSMWYSISSYSSISSCQID